MAEFQSRKRQERALPVEMQYPFNVAVDFTQLQPTALRRYLAYYNLEAPPGGSQEDLAVTVARHFNNECQRTDEESSIGYFISYLRASQGDVETSHDIVTRLQQRTEVQPIHWSSDIDNASVEEEPTIRHELDEAIRRHQVEELEHSKRKRLEDEDDDSKDSKRKKRRPRLYCVCHGHSFGAMIACDNKKCQDRSNWYHMTCVNLDPSEPPPDTWYCPSCQRHDDVDIPENQYRKPVASVTYGDMISHALAVLPEGKATFKEICDFVEQEYESQLNWKLESDQRKSPVWKSSVRKILFSNVRFRKHPEGKGLFCLAA